MLVRVTPVELVQIISRLRVAQPITDAYEATKPMGCAVRSAGTWSNQREHLLGWLAGFDGPGVYGRNARNLDARAAYNGLQCAPALLWLAEALGEQQSVVREAVSEVRSAPTRAASQCAAVRRIVPWSRIEELCENRHG